MSDVRFNKSCKLKINDKELKFSYMLFKIIQARFEQVLRLFNKTNYTFYFIEEKSWFKYVPRHTKRVEVACHANCNNKFL